MITLRILWNYYNYQNESRCNGHIVSRSQKAHESFWRRSFSNQKRRSDVYR